MSKNKQLYHLSLLPFSIRTSFILIIFIYFNIEKRSKRKIESFFFYFKVNVCDEFNIFDVLKDERFIYLF